MSFDFDFDNLSDRMSEVEAKRVSREYLGEGTHVVSIVAIETRDTQQGKTVCIIEADVLSSTMYAPGTGVKQIYAIARDIAWREKKNLGLLKAMIQAAKPGVAIDSSMLKACLSGGPASELAGKVIKVIARAETSKNGKAYLDFSYCVAKEGESYSPTPVNAQDVESRLDEAFGASASEEVTEDEVPDFDLG